MKQSLLLCLALGLTYLAFGQGRFLAAPDSLCDNNMRVYGVFAGDSILITCDTMYLVNKVAVQNYRAFRRYAQHTERGQVFEALNQLYERRLSEQEAEYDSLMEVLMRFQSASQSTMGEIEGRAESIDLHLATIDSSLVKANQTLEEVRKSVRRERNRGWLKKLSIGLGGVGVGLLLGMLLGQNGGGA